MRLRETTLVAGREVRESLRSRWFLFAAGGFLLLALGLSALGVSGSDRSGLAGFDRTTASLLHLALVFVPLLTISLGAHAVAGEREDGSLGFLLSQPVTRSEVFAGKYLGLLASVAASILLGFGVSGLAIGVASGGGDAGAFLGLVLLVLLLAAATLGLGIALSVVAGTRARVAGLAFALWLVLVYLSDLGTIGLVLARSLGPAQVFFLALLNPVEQARVLGTLLLSERPDVLGPVGLYGQDVFGPEGLVLLLVSTLLLAAALPLAAGYLVFRKVVVP